MRHTEAVPFALPRPPADLQRAPVTKRSLGVGVRAAMRLRHGVRLAREVSRYGAEQRLWWLVPVITIIVVLALAITTTTTALPVAVYTLF